jgi:hypothetical protein
MPMPGLIVLFGSGETSSSGQKVFNFVFQSLSSSPRVALLETPAGFELNSARVIDRVKTFLLHHLQNYDPEITVIPARKRGTNYSPDDPAIVYPLLEADLIFMGPGSPSYAIRQLRDSLAWYYMLARHRLGAAIVLASAATIAVGAYSLPVYEIYKVGEDLHWKKGLDLFALYGMPLVFIPHWNNNEGGSELDTSRCFMGKERFAELMQTLPSELTVIGIDEHTALVIDPQKRECHVLGAGGVTLLHPPSKPSADGGGSQDSDLQKVAMRRNAHLHRYPSGISFPLDDWFPFQVPEDGAGLPSQVWEYAVEMKNMLKHQRKAAYDLKPPPDVLELAEKRQKAREHGNWDDADSLRAQINALGWRVKDTPEGSHLEHNG